MQKIKDLSGQQFNKLLVLKKVKRDCHKCYYECKCECGNITIVEGSSLTSGNTKSCGCLHRQQLINRNYKHGERHTRLYGIWLNMKQRCSSNKERYKSWQGKGITVCKDWSDSFIEFKLWAMANGYADNLTIDRIDVQGNYEPSNCRWITKQQQQFNKTNTRYFDYKGQKKCLAEWAEIFGINKPTLYNRIYNLGWGIERALETEVRKK